MVESSSTLPLLSSMRLEVRVSGAFPPVGVSRKGSRLETVRFTSPVQEPAIDWRTRDYPN